MTERDLFIAALHQRDPAGRAAFLARACGDDRTLRDRVEGLLREQEQLGSFLERPAADLSETGAFTAAPCDEALCERPGTVVGPYKLLEQIGEGGFGVVFMAEQTQPVRRKVALKVLKPGMDTRQVVARFEAERQALALMDHPNIARVFDGAQTASGRPYFVMELVRGVPITGFCDQNQLPVRERLRLFVDVCRAVQHAHQKGVIHRDIKPSNVLVTLHDGVPVVKVIDFGIAKATGQQLTDKTLFTNFAQLVGTPLYMSPEQAEMSGLDVDTRSDIYSLGVLLYELLTGTTPFDRERLRTAAYDEIRRIIREEDPPRPSARISTLGQTAATVSANRQSDPKRLRQLCRGELDWVVMKCLEKDRNRRYETANGLARDVERYLQDEPVTACPPTAGYRLRKFARRNRRALAVGGLLAGLFLVLAVGLPVTGVLYAERDAALDARARAEGAEAEARGFLRRALAAERENKVREHLARATALRRSGQPGQRFAALDEISKALKLEPAPELRGQLRTEAIGCLLLPDFEAAQEWPGRPVGGLGFAVDDAFGRYARGDRDGNVSVRRLSDAAELCLLPGVGQLGDYAGIEFSPDGRILVQLSPEAPLCRLRLWRLDGGEPRLVLDRSAAGAAAFRPDSREVAVPGPDGTIEVHDPASGEVLRRFPSGLGKGTTSRPTWNPTQPVLAISTRKSVRLLDAGTGRLLREIEIPGGFSWFDWHPEGRLLAVSSGTPDLKIYLWDTQTGRLAQPPLVGHRQGGVIVRFNRAGDRLLSNDWSGIWRLWDVRTGRQLLTQPAGGTCLQFGPDDSQAAASAEHAPRPCRLFRFRAGSEFSTVARHKDGPEPAGFLWQSQFDATGRLLAVRTRDGIALLDVRRREVVGHLALPVNVPLRFEPGNAALLTYGDNGLLRWPLCPDPDGKAASRLGPPEVLLAGTTEYTWGCSEDATVIGIPRPFKDGAFVYRRAEERLLELTPQEDVRTCAVSASGRWVATGSHKLREGSGARVWDAQTGRLVRELPVGGCCAVGFSPDDRWLVTTSGGVRLWAVGTWEEGPKLGDAVWGFAFTHDGRLLALEDAPGVVRLVVPETGKEVARLPSPELSRLQPLCFTPDGALLITLARETEVLHVFDLRAIRRQLAELGLDWDQPPLPPPADEGGLPPLEIEVDLGKITPRERPAP